MSTNIELILDAVCDALEGVTPQVRDDVPFKRWTGEKPIEQAPIELRERSFQLRLGKSLRPRTLSSSSQQWQRAELLLVVGYNFTEPRQNDSAQFDTGIHILPWVDHGAIVKTLQIDNVFSAVSNVKRLMLIDAETPTDTSRTWRFDLEWAESYA